ncbi:hypothetical protein PI126_g19613 [Phytophthora idaei]|nr:hypothetical protein PI126_g19613 [Phytophthora idaei]
MAYLPDSRFSNSTVEQGDIGYLKEKGLLRDDVDVSMDRQDAGEFGQAYARGDNIASTPFEYCSSDVKSFARPWLLSSYG